MADILLLDNTTIDKIAAGEVVERPVNVVKELVENSIDGKATIINIEIKNGGQDLIRITDNGVGIKSTQVQTAFLRHATSKLTNISDFESLNSLGFRGEALSSISAVSKTEMITKTEDSLLGTHISIEGGKVTEIAEVGAPNGTTVIVRQLFYNTPARKKFLKSNASEASKIEELIEKIVLSHPDISFSFINNGKTKISTSGNGNLKDVVYNLFGKDIYDRLLEVKLNDTSIGIHGFITRPEYNLGTREGEIFFVNNRLVGSRELSIAVEQGFHGFLMQHRFPFAILFIDVAPSFVDVNVHPQKAEIRFSDIQFITETLTAAIISTLKEPELITAVKGEDFGEINDSSVDSVNALNNCAASNIDNTKNEPVVKEYVKTYTTNNSYNIDDDDDDNDNTECTNDLIDTIVTANTRPLEPFETTRQAQKVQNEVPLESSIPEYRQENMFENRLIDDKPLKNYKVIGQIFETYWLITLDDTLYIVDQHAAHEKVNYERLLKSFLNSEEAPTQYINPPMIMNLTRGEEAVLSDNFNLFSKIGFEIEEFGDRSYAIRGIPVELYGNTADDMFKRLLFELNEHEKIKQPEVILEKLASMSCKAAIKGGMRISHEEMNELMKQLMEIDNPYHCPHGRPVFISITKYELEKKFKRIV